MIDLHACESTIGNAVLGVAGLTSRAGENQILHGQIVACICFQAAAVRSVDDGSTLAVGGHRESVVGLIEQDRAGEPLAALEADGVAGIEVGGIDFFDAPPGLGLSAGIRIIARRADIVVLCTSDAWTDNDSRINEMLSIS